MRSEVTRLLTEVVEEVKEFNSVAREDITVEAASKAINRLVKVLDKMVRHDGLWEHLFRSTRTSLDPKAVRNPAGAGAFLTELADAFSLAQEEILTLVGYRSPPPPPVHELVLETKRAFLVQDVEASWTTSSVEAARTQLGKFVSEVRGHLDSADPIAIRALYKRLRKTAASVVLVAIVAHPQIKSGEEFSVGLTAAESNQVQLTVVIPSSWTTWKIKTTKESMGSVLINVASIDVEHTVDPERLERLERSKGAEVEQPTPDTPKSAEEERPVENSQELSVDGIDEFTSERLKSTEWVINDREISPEHKPEGGLESTPGGPESI